MDKTCLCCLVDKPLTEFYCDPQNLDGHKNACKSCYKSRQRKWDQAHPEYKIWINLRLRCLNPRDPEFRNYGARGIKVCERWSDFDTFYADVGPRPSPELTFDRIDNDGNYEPGNVRWATRSEQRRNRRPQAEWVR